MQSVCSAVVGLIANRVGARLNRRREIDGSRAIARMWPQPQPSASLTALVTLGVVAASLAGWSASAQSAPTSAPSTAEKATTAVLVNKKNSMLYVVEYRGGKYETLKEYKATLGKVIGDKEIEGDLKTPEGIYTFTSVRTPPNLAPKFGDMAFPLNYPNSFDEIAGRNGSHIMLHATDTPKRLDQKYDSEGCIVIRNDELAEVKRHIRIGLTPILIFEDLTPEYMNPGEDPSLQTFFKSWISAWESRDVNAYIDFYHTDFKAQGKDKAQWKTYKGALTSRYASIDVGERDVRIYRHPKYSMITFTQNYVSVGSRGSAGFKAPRGTKILYVAEESGKPKIIAETFTPLMW